MDIDNYIIPHKYHYPARVDYRGSTSLLQIREKFEEANLSARVSQSPFAHFFAVRPLQFSGVLIHQLLLRKIPSKREDELHFMLGDKDCRFGLPEFTLITGLNSVSDTSSADDKPKSEMSDRLVERFFPGNKSVKLSELRKAFKDCTEEDDIWKLGLCYLIEGVIFGKEIREAVSKNVLRLVEDLDLFYSFPWGVTSWNMTVKSLNKDLREYFKNVNEKKGNRHYGVKGFAPALQYWAYEVIPEIAKEFGVYAGSQTPRMLSWSNNKVIPTNKLIAPILNKNKLEVFKELRPRPEASDFYNGWFHENIKQQSQDFDFQDVKPPRSVLPMSAPKMSWASASKAASTPTRSESILVHELLKIHEDHRSLFLKKLDENQSEIQKILTDMNKKIAEVEKNAAEGRKEQDEQRHIPITEGKKNQSSETSTLRSKQENRGGTRKEKLRNNSSRFDQDNNYRDVKRYKPLDYGQAENVSSSESDVWNLPAPKSSGERLAEHVVCAFCHSSKISEETGSLLHYFEEKLVFGQEAMLSNVIHVHRLCIDWAPQVFSIDERAQNLMAEVARGSKLKCSKCGKKGAVLGCYMKSCRKSYHVPCALKTSKCRWDYENYLMLCPSHSSVRFRKEKSNPGGNVSNWHAISALASCQQSYVAALPDKDRKWRFCGSGLSIEEKSLLVKFGKMNGSSVSMFWNPNVTHVIAATDETGACTRTLKVLMAILNGQWIVKVDWIKACIEAKSHVDEEPFEISLDNYGRRDSPKRGRLWTLTNGPKLLGGLNFYFVGDFRQSYRKDLEDLVIAGGGTLIKSREELSGQSCDVAKAGRTASLVIYNLDPPEKSKPGEEALIMWRRVSEAEDVAMQSRSGVIGHTWLLESIAAYKLQPLV